MHDRDLMEIMARKISELSRRLAALEQRDRPNGGGTGGGATTLDALTDVTLDAPADNELLAYDELLSQWVNRSAAEAGLAAADHNHDAAYAALAHKARHQPGGADAMAVDADGSTGSLRTLGTGSRQAAPGNHGHDALYASIAHKNRHAMGGADALSPSDIGAALAGEGVFKGSNHDHVYGAGAQIAYSSLSGIPATFTPAAHKASHQPGGADALAVDAVAGTASLRTLGTGAAQAAAGDHNHSTLYAALAHKARHATGGADALAPGDIGAATSGHNHDSAYAPIAKGVTNGDSHNHLGGDGGTISYSSLSGIPGKSWVQLETVYAVRSGATLSSGSYETITLDNTKVPADAYAVHVSMVAKSTVAGDAGYYFIGSSSSGDNRFLFGLYMQTFFQNNGGNCRCSKSGSNAVIYGNFAVNGGTITYTVKILGYWI